LNQNEIFPNLSNDFSLSPEKSLTLGRTKCTNLSTKSYALSHLNVTFNITGIHSLNLKLLTDFLALIKTGF